MLMKFNLIKWKICKKNICKEKQDNNEKKTKMCYKCNKLNYFAKNCHSKMQ